MRICLIFLIPCSVCISLYPLPRFFRVPSSRITWGLFQMCSYSVWFVLCGSFCAVLLVFLHVLALSLCLLVVLLALSLSDHFVLLSWMCHSPVFPFPCSRFSSFFRFFVRFWSFHFIFFGCCAVRVGSGDFSLGQVVSAGAVV